MYDNYKQGRNALQGCTFFPNLLFYTEKRKNLEYFAQLSVWLRQKKLGYEKLQGGGKMAQLTFGGGKFFLGVQKL